jgi:predicted Fe-Mo cluster-binding NifX family protein
MRTIITSSENKITAAFDKRFGRAAWFCLYDEQSGEIEFIENLNLNASNGAGTKAAEKAVELNVKKIISGDFGPKAKDLLDKFEIQMVILKDDNLTVENIINKLKN